MQIKVRVRTNDVNVERRNNQLVHSGFILYDNCSEVKYGDSVFASLDQFRIVTCQPRSIKEMRQNPIPNTHPETGDVIHNLIYMVRDIDATESRLSTDLQFRGKTRIEDRNKLTKEEIATNNFYTTPYHYNTIEWVDRLNNKRYRLVFDTVAFITDDQGNTLRKIDG